MQNDALPQQQVALALGLEGVGLLGRRHPHAELPHRAASRWG